MGRVEKKFEWCLRHGKGGPKHKGIKKIGRSIGESQKQMRKAESDLDTMQYLYDGSKTDWLASAAFYAMYHSLLAVLYKIGYESRNQECTIAVIEKLMNDKTISLEQEYVSMIRSLQEGEEDAKSVREEMQYGSETSLENERCAKLMDNAKRFVDRIKELLEEIR